MVASRGASKQLGEALADGGLADAESNEEFLQAHNTINRITGTTGTGMFAPYQAPRIAAAKDAIEIHCLHDPVRLSGHTLRGLMIDVGLSGFGRDASIGLGKFTVESAAAPQFDQGATPSSRSRLAVRSPKRWTQAKLLSRFHPVRPPRRTRFRR